MKFVSLKMLLAGLVACTALLPAHADEKAKTFTFGIVPQTAQSKLSRDWSPVLKYLEEKTGYKFQFATARDISMFGNRLAEEKYDFAFMNPRDYTQFHKSNGYEAFAKIKNVKLKGMIVVRNDSPVQKLEDLDDKELVFPSQAFAADTVLRAVLREKNINVIPHFVASHDTVYRNIAKGRYAAGGGVMHTFKNTAPENRDQLRVLWTSEGYTPHAFAAHGRVPRDVVMQVQQVLTEMEKDPIGKKLLKGITAPDGLEAAQNADWDDVRKLLNI
ncbi:MAG: phosphate/phosphite/phosphonate ABC transporter substrate-binding protein [Gammaproteobacteria bacterium]|nr:phosphate/phosphite/phosphonate ABC transporter substrate-binding protein [Gammaproteobacteria bacterium]